MSKKEDKYGRVTRRQFMQTAAAAAATSALGVRSANAAKPSDLNTPPGHTDADIILQNGKIHTMDDDGRVVSSLAIKDGRFIGVGNPQPGPRTKVIDLGGRTVVPGIIDNHNHIVLMGNRPGYHTPLENAYSIQDVQKIYAARIASLPDPLSDRYRQWITTIGGFHSNHFYTNPNDPLSGRMPTLAELDAVSAIVPMFISIGFTGPAVTNSAGKRLLEGFSWGSPPKPVVVGTDGSIVNQPPPGDTQNVGRALLYLRQTLLNPAERRRSVIDAMNYAATVGVTTHLDQGAFQATNTPADGAAHEDNFTMHIPFLQVYEQDKGIIRLRINFLHMDTDDTTPELAQRLKNAFPFFGGDMVRTGGIGEFIATYPPSHSFNPAAELVAQKGWRAEVHSLTRRSRNLTTGVINKADWEPELDGFEDANSKTPGIVRDMRWVIAHVPGITQDGIDRMQKLGGGFSLTGWQYLAGALPNPLTTVDAFYAGPPFRMIVDSSYKPDGVHVGMSSDGMQIAPMNPWLHMYFATTGINTKGVLINPNQQINRQEALSLYTRQNGWFLREEDQLGTIEDGKLADLVVLNSDYFTVPNEGLKKIRSVMTIVDGKIVYDTGVLDTRG